MAVYSWGSLYKGKPGWQRINGAIEGKRILLKFGIPPDTTIIYLKLRNAKSLFVERIEKDKFRRGWLDRMKWEPRPVPPKADGKAF
ncbi:MAG: hypothetical protein ABSC19_09525 [Syntrophorhabdales bacterium]